MSNTSSTVDFQSLLKRAYVSLEKMQSKLNAFERSRTEPIAVIGLGCRFPGKSNDPESYWRLLRNGVDAVTEVPPVRWNLDAYYDPNPGMPGKMYTRYGAFLDRVDQFDPQFFGIAPREAVSMDPQQRLLLESAWEALEHACQAPDKLDGSPTGVFVGISNNDYSQLFDDPKRIDAYTPTGNSLSVASGRLSYVLGLRGPSLIVDTACSSSLVAVHLACQSLHAGECRMALACGVNLVLSPLSTIAISELRMMAPDGRCKAFDAAADGFVRGEGCGVVVLKRLSDALEDRDNILALIRGSAVNQDGRSSGLTAPNGPAQEEVIRKALAAGGVEPSQLSYVEAHGTGTSLGDPIEVHALAAALGQSRSADHALAIGSVKTNIGHLEAAAGIAGLIKVVLALQHHEIPPHLHLKKLNPYIPWNELPVVVPTKATPWSPANGGRRIAGVSSFGFSGTNAHVVIEEAPVTEQPKSKTERPLHLLALSAKTPEALKQLAGRFEQHLAGHPDQSLPNICFSANTGRSHFTHRLAIVAESSDQARQQLAAFVASISLHQVATAPCSDSISKKSKVIFLFSGQGSQYPAMARLLFDTEPVFRNALVECDQILRPYLESSLLSVLYPEDPSQPSLLRETRYTQPALFAVEYALAQLWRSWGVEPDAVIGHSLGEYSAACIAGVFNLEDALKLIAERARLMQALPAGGEMVSVLADYDRLARAIRPYSQDLSVAAINGPQSVVISGRRETLRRLVDTLQTEGVRSQTLAVSHAFHSPLMEPMLEAFEDKAGKLRYSAPQIALVSNLTGKFIGNRDLMDAGYWRQHIRQPVRFSEGIQTLVQEGYKVFVEIGPHPTLSALGREIDNAALWLPTLRKGRGDWQQILETLAGLYTRGGAIDWSGFDRAYPRRRLPLPTYPFQRKRYWLEAAETKTQSQPVSPKGDAFNLAEWLYEVHWQAKPLAEAPGANNPPGNWLIFADRGGLGAELARLIKESGGKSTLVFAGESYGVSGDGHFQLHPTEPEQFLQFIRDQAGNDFTGIAHLWSLDLAEDQAHTPGTLLLAEMLSCAGVLHVVQALAKSGKSPRLWLVTRASQAVEPHRDPLAVTQAPLWGLGKVIALEHPELWGGLIDLEHLPSEDEAVTLLQQLTASDGEDQVALRGGERYVARLVRAWERTLPACSDAREPDSSKPATAGSNSTQDACAPRPGHFAFSNEATYLITGGLGGLGLRVARWMVDQGARHLVLVGRRPPSSAAQEALTVFEQQGAHVLALQADVSQQDQVTRLLAGLSSSLPPLRGIVHAAGVLDDGVLYRQQWQRFESVLAPKVLGSWNLHTMTRALPLDFFVMFSSASSLLGSPAQGNYAAANAFMDALALERQRQGLPALSINWGPWAEAGMAARTGSEERRTAQGIGVIAPEQGLQTLKQLLGRESGQLAVLPAQWHKLIPRFRPGGQSRFLAELAAGEIPEHTKTSENLNKGGAFVAQLLRLPGPQREEYVKSYLKRQTATILGTNEKEIPGSINVLELGMDSLMVMELLNDLNQNLQFTLYPREFYERPSIDALAKYLAAELERVHGGSKSELEQAALPSALPVARTRSFPDKPVVRNGPIVFLLSSPRSGSTLLRVMLAGHPGLFCPPELHLLPFASMVERHEQLDRSYLGEGLQRAFMELRGLDANESKALVNKLDEEDVPVQEVYRVLQESVGTRLVVDKSPTYAGSKEILRRAEDLFEGARYIHLIRHPYAVMESFVRRRIHVLIGAAEVDPYLAAEQVWATGNRNVLDFLASVDPRRHHRIYYEELVREPERIMAGLCEFLGIPFDEAVLKPYEGRRMTDGVHSQSLPIGDPNFMMHDRIEPELSEKWKKISLSRPLAVSTRELAADLEYELPLEPEISPQPLSPLPMRERYVDVRGLGICLCSWGPEDGPLLVLVHGILEHGAAWERVAVPLARLGYHVVAPDLRGHGLSSHVGAGASYHLIDFLADLEVVVREIAETPFTLVGHSMGATVAAMYASIRPERVRTLVLVECPLPQDNDADKALENLATHLNYLVTPVRHAVLPDVAAAANRLRRLTPSMPEETALRMAQRITEPCPRGVQWRWDPLLRTRAGIAFHGTENLNLSRYLEVLGKIQASTTLVYGNTSNAVSAEQVSLQLRKIPRSRQIVLPGGHNLHMDCPEAVAEIIASVADVPKGSDQVGSVSSKS